MEKINEDLTCPISLEILNDPIPLPCCGTVFSRESLIQAFNVKRDCPFCQKTIDKEFNIYTVKANIFITKILHKYYQEVKKTNYEHKPYKYLYDKDNKLFQLEASFDVRFKGLIYKQHRCDNSILLLKNGIIDGIEINYRKYNFDIYDIILFYWSNGKYISFIALDAFERIFKKDFTKNFAKKFIIDQTFNPGELLEIYKKLESINDKLYDDLSNLFSSEPPNKKRKVN